MRLDVICLGACRAHIFSIHIGAAGSQAARAFCTTAASALRSGDLALTVGFVQRNTTPKKSRGVRCGPDSSNMTLRVLAACTTRFETPAPANATVSREQMASIICL